MADPIYLALDAGTGGGRAVVFDHQGRLLRRAYRPWEYHTPAGLEPYGKEFSAEHFWSLLAAAGREALQGLDLSRLAAVSSTAMRQGCVFLDGSGRELYAGPNRDARGIEAGLELEAKIAEERAAGITGRWPPWIFVPGRLWWFRLNAPEIFRRIARVLMLNDWILYRLSGETAAELTAAGDSFLLDIRTRQWSTELLSAWELPAAWFPPLVAAGEQVGRVSESAAAQTGIPAGTPVVAGAADSQAGLWAAGVMEPGQVGVIAGTTAPVMAVCAEPRLGPAGRVWTNCHLTPGRWLVESNCGDAGKVLRWYVEGHAGGDYAALLARAETISPGANLVVAALGPMVFNLKEINPARRTGFLFPFPLELDQVSPGAMVRAILENIAYAVRGNLEQILPVLADAPKSITLTGGMARSLLFARIVSAVLARPVTVVSAPETSALGAALAGAVGVGEKPDLNSAAAGLLLPRQVVEPDPGWVSEYADLYPDWGEQVKRFETSLEE